jgi:hypothetical protein
MPPNRDLLPWWDHVPWMTDPGLAYVKGLQDGVELGRDQLNAELVAVLASALSGRRTTDYRHAVRIHTRTLDVLARRAAADRGGVHDART